jgi:hypothetical protein
MWASLKNQERTKADTEHTIYLLWQSIVLEPKMNGGGRSENARMIAANIAASPASPPEKIRGGRAGGRAERRKAMVERGRSWEATRGRRTEMNPYQVGGR